MNKSFPHNTQKRLPPYNEMDPRCRSDKDWLKEQMVKLERSDIQCNDRPGSIGINQWVAHYDESRSTVMTPEGLKYSPKLFKTDNVTKYFEPTQEEWSDFLLKLPHNDDRITSLIEELDARNTVIHSLLKMLNFATAPIALQFSAEDPFLSKKETDLVNREISTWHDMAEDMKAIMVAKYIHANMINEKNTRLFTAQNFKFREGVTDAEFDSGVADLIKQQLAENNIKLETKVQKQNTQLEKLHDDLQKANQDKITQATEIERLTTEIKEVQKTQTDNPEVALSDDKSLKSNKVKMEFLLQKTKNS